MPDIILDLDGPAVTISFNYLENKEYMLVKAGKSRLQHLGGDAGACGFRYVLTCVYMSRYICIFSAVDGGEVHILDLFDFDEDGRKILRRYLTDEEVSKIAEMLGKAIEIRSRLK